MTATGEGGLSHSITFPVFNDQVLNSEILFDEEMQLGNDENKLSLQAKIEYAVGVSPVSSKWYVDGIEVGNALNLNLTEDQLIDLGYDIGSTIQITHIAEAMLDSDSTGHIFTKESSLDVTLLNRFDYYDDFSKVTPEIVNYEYGDPSTTQDPVIIDGYPSTEDTVLTSFPVHVPGASFLLMTAFAATPHGDGMGHHHFNKGLLTGLNKIEGFSDDVIDLAWGLTTSPFSKDGYKHGGNGHGEYNKAMRKLIQDEINAGKLDPKTVTISQMKEWITRISEGKNPLNGNTITESSSDTEKIIKSFVEDEILENLEDGEELLREYPSDVEAIEQGKKWQKQEFDGLARKYHNDIIKIQEEIDAEIDAGKRPSAKNLKKLETAQKNAKYYGEQAKSIAKRIPGSKVSSYVGRISNLLIKSKVVKIAGPLLTILTVQNEIEARGWKLGLAVSTPVVGDFIAVAVDGKALAEAVHDLNQLSDVNDKLVETSNLVKQTAVNRQFKDIIKKYSKWQLKPSCSFETEAQRDQFETAVKVLNGRIEAATQLKFKLNGQPSGNVDDIDINVDKNKIHNAEKNFEDALKALCFEEPNGPAA